MQLLQRSDSYTRVQEAHPEASSSGRGAEINSKVADIEPCQRACVWPSASAAATGLASPVSLRASPVPPSSSYSAASRPSPAPRVIVPAVTLSPSSPLAFSLQQLANHPILNFQSHHASISSAPQHLLSLAPAIPFPPFCLNLLHPPPLQALHPRSPTVLSFLYLQIFRASLRNPFYPRVQARFRPRMHEPSFLLVNKRAGVLCGSEQHPSGCISSVCMYMQLVVLFEQDNPDDHE